MYYFLMRMELTPALLTVGQMGLVSVVNGMIGVVAVIPLHTAMMQALGKTDLYRRMMGTRHTGTTEKEERQ